MMYVKKYIAEFFRLKDPAAEQLSADDLERIDQGILYELEFKLRQFLHPDVLQDLRRILLSQLSILLFYIELPVYRF